MTEELDVDALEEEFHRGWAFVNVKTRVLAIIRHLRALERVRVAAGLLVTACDAGGDIPQPEFADLWEALAAVGKEE